MRISTIALANLRRRKSKAVLLGLGIAIGIATVVALGELSRAIREEVGAQMDRYGANIIVVPQSNSVAMEYGGVALPGVTFDVKPLHDSDVAAIHSIRYRNRLSVVAPKLLASAKVGDTPVVVSGVDFPSELRMKQWWRIEGAKPQASNDVLVGADLAQSLGIAQVHSGTMPAAAGQHHGEAAVHIALLRDQVTIDGVPHRVSGVLHPTGGPEDRMIVGSLAHVQKLAAKPAELSVIEVSALCKDCPVEDIVAQIREKVPQARVAAVQQAVQARNDMVNRLSRFSAVAGAVVLFVGGLMIFTATLGSVAERTREIGVMRAIGFRRTHILRGLILEVLIVSAAGGIAGWAAGLAASWAALPYFAEAETRLPVHPELLALAVIAALAIGVASSLYPALRASRLDPAEAVRSM